MFRVVAGDFAYATTTPWASCCSTMHKEPSDSPDERSTKRDFNLRVKSATCAKLRMSTVIIRSDVSNQDSVKEPAVVVMRRLKNGTNAHCPLQEYDLFDLSSWAW